MNRRPSVPPVYRPQNQTRAMQPKLATAPQMKKQPVVPPVYKPQPSATPAQPARTRVVQRYARVPVAKQKPGKWAGLGADLRISDDGKMAVRDSGTGAGGHDFYATTDVIAASAVTLARINSPITLDADISRTLRGRIPGKKTEITLVRVIVSNSSTGTSGDALKTRENCNYNAWNVMGVEEFRGGYGVAVASPAGLEYWDKDTQGGGGEVPVIDRLRREWTARQTGQDPATITKDESKKGYKDLSTKERARLAAAYGANQFAEVAVGGAMEVYNAGGATGANFPAHFAPIIAVSGQDYVTLENWAKGTPDPTDPANPRLRAPGDTILASGAWHFRMYGSAKKGDDQSFYGEHVKDDEYGGAKGTLVISHRRVPTPGQ